MGYRLGVDLGTTYTSAAVARDGRAEVIGLGDRSAQVPSVLFLLEDGTFLFGEAAERQAAGQPHRVAREVKRRIGDPVNVYLAGAPMAPHVLIAKLLRWVADQVGAGQGGPPDEVVVCHPANWGPHKLEQVEQVLSGAGLRGSRLLSEPEAAAVHFAATDRLRPGETVAVYDLGGGTFDAVVLRKTEHGFEILGEPQGIEHLGGADFDEAIFEHVRRFVPIDAGELDAATSAGLVRLRRDCAEAKEALSQSTAVTIPVMLPGAQTGVRMTRAEFEDLIRPSVETTIDCLERALRHAEVAASELTAILLVGGSARIPLVSERVTARVGRPVALSPQPKLCVAMGAALSPSPDRKISSPVPPSSAAPAARSTPAERTAVLDPSAPARTAEPAVAPARRPAGRTSVSRPAAYGLAALVLGLLGVLIAFLGPQSDVTTELAWNSATGKTDVLRPSPRAGTKMTPTVLGADLPGDPVGMVGGRFEIGRGYRIFLAGPAVATFDSPYEPRRLIRSGGHWWSGFATIPGAAMVIGLLFATAYAESLLRVLRRRRGVVRAGELLGMAGVGAVLAGVVLVAAWMVGNLPTPGAAGVVLVCVTAASGLLGVAVAVRL